MHALKEKEDIQEKQLIQNELISVFFLVIIYFQISRSFSSVLAKVWNWKKKSVQIAILVSLVLVFSPSSYCSRSSPPTFFFFSFLFLHFSYSLFFAMLYCCVCDANVLCYVVLFSYQRWIRKLIKKILFQIKLSIVFCCCCCCCCLGQDCLPVHSKILC